MEEKQTIETEVKETETETTDNEKNSSETKQPTPAELQAQIQKLMVENAKLKRSNDKNSSEAADFKRKWKESLSEVEQANLEKAEKEAERDAQFDEMKKALEIYKAKDEFVMQGYTADEAQRAAVAVSENDKDEIRKIQGQVLERKVKERTAEILKSRPDIRTGTSDAKITKEQFAAMSLTDRTKLKRENPDEYERLKSL